MSASRSSSSCLTLPPKAYSSYPTIHSWAHNLPSKSWPTGSCLCPPFPEAQVWFYTNDIFLWGHSSDHSLKTRHSGSFKTTVGKAHQLQWTYSSYLIHLYKPIYTATCKGRSWLRYPEKESLQSIFVVRDILVSVLGDSPMQTITSLSYAFWTLPIWCLRLAT